jgi:hypothetical protein
MHLDHYGLKRLAMFDFYRQVSRWIIAIRTQISIPANSLECAANPRDNLWFALKLGIDLPVDLERTHLS